MKKYIYTAALLGAMTLASCQKEEAGIDFNSDPEAVKISATVGNSIFSRSNPTGDVATQKAFNSGDKIGVSADAQAVVTYTYDGTKWIPAANTYLKWTQDAMNFTAYYPATAGTDAQNFNLPTDQSDLPKIAAADYMTAASVSKNKADGDVSLELSRQTARIIVKIAGFNDQYATDYSVSAVSVSGNNNGYVAGGVQAGKVTVSAYKATDFYALLIPTTADGGTTFLTLTVTNGTITETLTVKGIPAHEAGKSYTYNVTVGKDQAKITGVTIADWQTGEPIADGDTEVEPVFSDANFVNVLTEAPYNVPVNAKGNIDPKDAKTKAALEAITELDVNNKNISDLSGIEYLTNLTKLECNRNSITSLNISKNTQLTYFDCYGNKLSSLDVSKNTELKTLCCDNNNLTSLNISNNIALMLLECQKNRLTSLDVTNNKELTILWCFVNQLTSLNISNNVKLEILECGLNQLTTLDFSNNEKLENLSCYGNRHKTLDVTMLPKLYILKCARQTTDGTTPQQLTLTLTTAQSELTNIKNYLDETVTPNIKDPQN